MSNDLISRSALMQSLRNNVLVDVTPNLEQAIDEQPTAYDVDKVVERLEEKVLNTSDTQIGISARMAFGKAIEIVKSGGILKR